MSFRVALVLAAALAAACHGARDDDRGGPSCGTVAMRFQIVATDQLAAAHLDPTTAAAATAQLPAVRDALVRACEDGGWSAAVRACLTRAADHVVFETCEQALTDDQRIALDRAARGPFVGPSW